MKEEQYLLLPTHFIGQVSQCKSGALFSPATIQVLRIKLKSLGLVAGTYILGWHRTRDPSTSACLVLGLQAGITLLYCAVIVCYPCFAVSYLTHLAFVL